MSLLKIAWRSIQHRGLSSTLTGLSMALGVALVVTVLVILNTVDNTFRQNAEGFHLILGAKGGRLQLVLNTIFHLDKPVENVPYDFYLEFTKKAEGVDAKALFKRLDTNGDDIISATLEVKPMVKLLCERADKTPDGVITKQELIAVASREPFARVKIDGAKLFSELDKAGKGSVSVDSELPQYILKMFAQPIASPQQIDAFFQTADADKTGSVTLEELIDILKKEPYSLVNVTPKQILKNCKADEDGNIPVDQPMPEDIKQEFSFPLVEEDEADEFLELADKEADGVINLVELTRAVNGPGRYGNVVEVAVPFCMGDSYEKNGRRYRVIGTTPQMFEVEYRADKKYQFAQGKNLDPDYFNEAHFFEAVIGSVVSRQAGLNLGDTFQPSHGISIEEEDEDHKHHAFTVVGVLAPTGTPNDRALFVNMEGFYVLDGHSKDGENRIHVHQHGDHTHVHVDPLPIEQREITSILIRMKDEAGYNADLLAQTLFTEINEGQVAQAVFPTRVVTNLFEDIIGNLKIILLILAVLIVVVAGIGIMVSIYNSMSERVRDIAVMRALGAGRSTVMMVVLLESSLLAFLGGLCGFVLGHGLIGWVLGPLFIEPQTGVTMRFFQFELYEALLIPGLVILSALAGFLPALAAYRTDVAKALSSAP